MDGGTQTRGENRHIEPVAARMKTATSASGPRLARTW